MPINGVDRPRLLPVPNQGSTIRPMFRTLAIAASGLSAQRQRMETIAQNVANADVTSGPDGATPYKKRTVIMQPANVTNANYVDGATGGIQALPGMPAAGTSGLPTFQIPEPDSARRVQVPVLLPVPTNENNAQLGVAVAGVAEDQNAGRRAYEPANPNADQDGWVTYPDIDTTQEHVNMYDAKRMYEANASVFQAAKSMLRASLDI